MATYEAPHGPNSAEPPSARYARPHAVRLSRTPRAARVAFALTCGAGLLGAAAGQILLPVKATAEARLLVGTCDIAAQAVPGYVEATKQLAGAYSRLGTGLVGPEDSADVAVTQLPETAVVRVQVKAATEAMAIEKANNLSKQIVATAMSANGPAAVEKAKENYVNAQSRLRDAKGATPSPQNDEQLLLAQAELDVHAEAYRKTLASSINPATGVSVISGATVETASKPRSALFGAVVGAGLAVVALTIRHVYRRR